MGSDYSPRRVVSLQPSATVILQDLGQLERLVACTKYCAEVCPEVRNSGIAIVADSWTAQSQQIAQAKPDLVIAAVPYQEKALAEILRSGARFLGLAPKSLNDIYSDIAAIDGIVNAGEEGARVIQGMQEEIACVRNRTKNLRKPRVFCEEWGKPLIASQPWVAELIEAAGGDFVGNPGVQTTFAAIEFLGAGGLISAWCGGGGRGALEKIIHARSWENVPAVKTGRVYCIRDEYLNTPAPTLVCGLRALAATIHPKCFPHVEGLRCIKIE